MVYWLNVTPQRSFWKWTLLGSVVALMLILGQASSVGGLKGLLQVGELSEVRQRIEIELGDVPLARDSGHDGQIYYAIALDLTGNDVPEKLDHGAYRYRRILFPAVASLLGLLSGEALLVGMIVATILSTGVAAGTTAALAAHFHKSDWFALVVVLNPGIWVSVRLLTADVLALALMVIGLYSVVTGRRLAPGVFALSALAKDIYLVTPGGVALSRRQRWPLFVVPALVLMLWMTVLTLTMGDGFTGRSNLALPFVGMADAYQVWLRSDLADMLYVAFALASVALGLGYSILVKSWLRWSILGWSLLAMVSSSWVWDFGNNAARAFSPIVVLVALAIVGSQQDHMIGRDRDRLTVPE